MKIPKKVITISSIILVVCFVFTASYSLGQREFPRYFSTDLPWADPDDYSTNDLSSAQKQTPFTIILPKYIPNEISQGPSFTGQLIDEYQNYTPLLISYSGSENRIIQIREYYQPSDEILEFFSDKIVLIADKPVMVFDYSDIELFEDNRLEYVSVFFHGWIEGSVLLSVYTHNIQQDEVVRIVCSMME
ncbi:MAG: hypothetical protein JW712_01905 [Dehalococcoidales bacterium]|nr:hypothetical protein [Dehalococcoidales bacterium]